MRLEQNFEDAIRSDASHIIVIRNQRVWHLEDLKHLDRFDSELERNLFSQFEICLASKRNLTVVSLVWHLHLEANSLLFDNLRPNLRAHAACVIDDCRGVFRREYGGLLQLGEESNLQCLWAEFCRRRRASSNG